MARRRDHQLRPERNDPPDAFLDGCDIDFTEETVPNDEVELLTLFAEALDPNTDKTVEEAEEEWNFLLGGDDENN